jgi:hypothetical protein
VARILTVLAATPIYAVEVHFCAATQDLSASYPMGGQYDIYVDAMRPVVPTQEAMSFGWGVTISLVLLPVTGDLGRALCTSGCTCARRSL